MENNRAVRTFGSENDSEKNSNIQVYSLGSNPTLEEFVKKYGKPYDPKTDKYERTPFAKEIVVSKMDPVYNMHTYWSKKHYKAIMEFIKHYTELGDIVLDQFCGSGMTGIASLATGRIPILIDISPSATFITKNYVTPISERKIDNALENLLETPLSRFEENKFGASSNREKLTLFTTGSTKLAEKPIATLRDELEWLYLTRCDRCGGKAKIRHVVWSQRFQCERCLRAVPLYDSIPVEVVDERGKKKLINACPYCLESGVKVEVKARSQRLGTVPMEVSYVCLSGCKPKKANRKHNDENERKREFFEKYDLGKIKEIKEMEIPHSYPTRMMMYVPEQQERWGYLWRRGYHHGIKRVDQFFTKRNLWALAALMEAIDKVEDEQCRDVFKFAFTGVVLGLSKMNRYRPNVSFPLNIQSGTYYVPSISSEEEILHHFINKVRRLKKGYVVLRSLLSDKGRIISTQNATSLSQLPDNSVDYIFTDPSYGDTTQYGELNFIWEAWLGFDSSWIKDEIIINPVRDIFEDDWAKGMRKAMAEAYRVLKPGKWMSLCYHDTSEGTWQTLQDILIDVGFELSEVGVLNPQQKSYNQIMADKVIKVDLILNCRKPREGEAVVHIKEELQIDEKVTDLIVNCLQRNPGLTKDKIWNIVVAKLVSKGEMEKHDFESLLKGIAMENEARMWFLKEQYEEIQPSERRKEQRASEAIEKFMGDRMESAALMEVEFYDILFFYLANYLRGKTRELAPMRRLPEILEDYFIRGKKGYSPPQTDDERALLKEARDKGLSRSIRRYIRHLTQASPFPEDKKPDISTLADWIKHCRRVGMYREGIILYEKSGLVVSKLSERQVVDLNEDYRICKRRVKRQRRLL